MADEKTPPTSPDSGGDVDLKARLRLSSKSLRQKAEEEEARKKAEEDARRNAAEQAKRRESERQDQFSLAGGAADPKTEWSAHWAVPDEEELKKLEALPQTGKGGKRFVLALMLILSLAFMLGVGYYFGRAFFGRSLENAKIEEAREMIDYHDRSRKDYFDAVEAHKKKITDLVETFQKPNLDPKFQLRQLYEFMAHCDAFLEKNKPISARELFGGKIYNADLAPEAVTYVDALNRMFMMTDQMLRERGILMLIGTGEEPDDQPPDPMLVYLAFEPDPRGDQAQIPWNKGEIIAIPQESWNALKPIAQDADPEAVEGATQPAQHYSMPVQKGAKAEVADVDTAAIAEFDAWPVIRRQESLYRLGLLERAKGTLSDLKAVADKVLWDRVGTKLKEYADKDLYFAF